MPAVILTTTGAGTWTVPNDCTVGTPVTVEAWGAGSGGSGTGATNGGGGAGGAYASSTYTITPNDAANGITNSIGAGGNGNTGVGSVGGDTSFSTNNLNLIRNSTNVGAVIGSPGIFPTNFNFVNNANLTASLVGFGTDPANGFAYTDIRVQGTASGQTLWLLAFDTATDVASTQYTMSVTHYIVGGSMSGIADFYVAFIDTPSFATVGQAIFTPTSVPTVRTATGTSAVGSTSFWPCIALDILVGNTCDITFRVSGYQQELGASATFWKSTPGYTLAKGGPAPITTGGGIGTSVGSIGSNAAFAGGSGRAFNAAGSPGGGSAGKDGAGVSATTTTSGAGDNSVGGAGVAVVSVSPGTAGTANIEGGAGGGALIAVLGTGGVGGAPGGGGGGSDHSAGTRTGGAGGGGQIRLTYAPAGKTWHRPVVSLFR